MRQESFGKPFGKRQQGSSGKPLLLFRMLTQGFVALGWGSVGLQALTSCKRHTAGTKFHAKKAHRRQRRSRHARAHTHTHRLAQIHAARRQAKSRILLPGFGPSNFFLLLEEKKKKDKIFILTFFFFSSLPPPPPLSPMATSSLITAPPILLPCGIPPPPGIEPGSSA